MTKLLLRPPDGVHAFTFHQGCGNPHEYDGVHAIDCGPCVEHVRLMGPEDRISQPHLRVPLVATGETPGEVDTMRRVEEAKRHAASWRLVEVEEPPELTADERAAERERLRARLAELEEDEPAPAKAPTTRKAPAKS